MFLRASTPRLPEARIDRRFHVRSLPLTSASEQTLTVAALAVITGVALVLRWIGAHQSLFGDELWTYAEVTPSSLGQVFHRVDLWENSPPVYLVLAWLSGKLGDPAIFIRLPSVIAGVAAVPVIYLLGDAIAGRRSGLTAAALFAVIPFAVFYGSEARPYALILFLIPLSTLALLRAMEAKGQSGRWWLVYWAACVLALYTHYTAGTAVAAQACWALITQRGRRRPVLAANAAVALAFLPWLRQLDDNTYSLVTLDALHPLTAGNIVTDPLRLILGHPYAAFDQVPGVVSIVVTCLVVAAVIAVTMRATRWGRGAAVPRWRSGGSLEVPAVGWLLVAMTAGVVALTLVYSALAVASIYESHHMITVVPYVCLLGGIAVAALRDRLAIIAACALVLAALLGSLRMLAEYPQPDFKGAAEAIARSAPPGTPVVEPWRIGHDPRDLSFDPLQQSLAIYLDDRFPLQHPANARAWPKGREVYVVEGGPSPGGAVNAMARSAGAQVLETRSFNGFLGVTLRRYSAIGNAFDAYVAQHPDAFPTYLQEHPRALRHFRRVLRARLTP
jgi:hypothetical protein